MPRPGGTHTSDLRVTMSTLFYAISQQPHVRPHIEGIMGRTDLDDSSKQQHIAALLKNTHKATP